MNFHLRFKGHLGALQDSRRQLMVQLEGLMRMLKSQQTSSPRSTPNSSPRSGKSPPMPQGNDNVVYLDTSMGNNFSDFQGHNSNNKYEIKWRRREILVTMQNKLVVVKYEAVLFPQVSDLSKNLTTNMNFNTFYN